MSELRSLIRRRMRAQGIKSDAELARRAGLGKSVVSVIMTTERRTQLPRNETLLALARALGVSVEALRLAAYKSIGAVDYVDERIPAHDGEVRIAGADFEDLTPEERDFLNDLVRGYVRDRKRAAVEAAEEEDLR